MTTTTLRLTGLASLCVVALCGCATPAATNKEAKSDKDEYVWVTPVGSNIPVRVRKGEHAAVGTSATATMAPEQLEKARTNGSIQDPGK